MKKILLACNAGMSTSLLVTRMEKAAQQLGVECEILAVPVTEAPKIANNWDIVLLGPQVRFMLSSMQKATSTPVIAIDTRAYGLMDGETVLKAALEKLS